VRRIPDRPAKFLYWRRLLSVALGLGEVGEWGPQFQMRWRQIYGEYPTPREQYVFWGAHSLGRPRDPKDPDDRPPDPALPAKLLAELKNDLEEVEREYEIYQRREAQLRAATRGACGVPPDPQFTQAQRTIESMARNIRQTIEQLIKLKRLNQPRPSARRRMTRARSGLRPKLSRSAEPAAKLRDPPVGAKTSPITMKATRCLKIQDRLRPIDGDRQAAGRGPAGRVGVSSPIEEPNAQAREVN